jgi:hypothetical protein
MCTCDESTEGGGEGGVEGRGEGRGEVLGIVRYQEERRTDGSECPDW